MKCISKFKDRIKSVRQFEEVCRSPSGGLGFYDDSITYPDGTMVHRVIHESIKTDEYEPEDFKVNHEEIKKELNNKVASFLYKQTNGEPQHYVLFIRKAPEMRKSTRLDIMTATNSEVWFGYARLSVFDTRLIDE